METCDDGAANADDAACTSSCQTAVCGDMLVQADVEECDDGNADDTDACVAGCKNAKCGDGLVGPGELCDDGNQVDDDACTNECASPNCGDGKLQAQQGEECDDGNQVDTDACLSTCLKAKCGDQDVQAGVEECDDGNAINNDACSNTCKKVVALVGSFQVMQGPAWMTNPPCYTCKEACALLFGGIAAQYACSINNVGVTGTGYLDGWGDGGGGPVRRVPRPRR